MISTKYANWAQVALYVLSSAFLFIWFLSMDEEAFTFKWFIDYPGLFILVTVYALPVIAFQFLAARFLLAKEGKVEKTILSTVIGLAAGFFFFLFLATTV